LLIISELALPSLSFALLFLSWAKLPALGERWFYILLIIFLFCLTLAMILKQSFEANARRVLVPDAFAELDRLPDRRPILFLRSFRRDLNDTGIRSWFFPPHGDSFEMIVTNMMREFGPVICIGKPGEDPPPVGSGRLYIYEEKWQQTVVEVLDVCQFVLLVHGSTTGLLFEVQQIVERVDPSKVIICVPHSRRRIASRLIIWEHFRTLTQNIFPRGLPTELGDALFVRFDSSWRPIIVESASRPKDIKHVLRAELMIRREA
jgi:hypothetical protein